MSLPSMLALIDTPSNGINPLDITSSLLHVVFRVYCLCRILALKGSVGELGKTLAPSKRQSVEIHGQVRENGDVRKSLCASGVSQIFKPKTWK
jgi:hypothetical protein